MKTSFAILVIVIIGFTANFCSRSTDKWSESILYYRVDLKKETIQLSHLDEHGKTIGSLNNLILRDSMNGTPVLFAMNGGMYLKDQSPQGLFIENTVEKNPLNLNDNSYGNFYLKPNGVFSISDNGTATVLQTLEYEKLSRVKYATQSGPMLLINGKKHPKFNKGSSNLNIRNGVGILPDGSVLFALSKKEINFYDFAQFFEENGCKNALYLDGYVSRAYYPEKGWIQKDGNFGVLIGVYKR